MKVTLNPAVKPTSYVKLLDAPDGAYVATKDGFVGTLIMKFGDNYVLIPDGYSRVLSLNRSRAESWSATNLVPFKGTVTLSFSD
jgi:hypothetical protein